MKHNSSASKGVVPAQITVFPAAEKEAGAKLVIEIAGRDSPAGIRPGQVFSRQADSLQVAVVPRERSRIVFRLKTGGKPAQHIIQFQVIVSVETFLRPQDVGLYPPAERTPTSGLGRYRQRQQPKQQDSREPAHYRGRSAPAWPQAQLST